MQLERIPRDRATDNVSRLEEERIYWRDLGTRMTNLRDSARDLYSFQNPFNDRMVRSSDESVLGATSNRGVSEQDRSFIVKQTAQADRFISSPLESSFRVEAGNYSFFVGKDEISFDFRGGSLREFVDAINRRSRDRIEASLVSVRPGASSLIIESKITGADNKLQFSGAAEDLGKEIGMVEFVNDSHILIEGSINAKAGERSSLEIYPVITTAPNLVLRFDTSTTVLPPDEWLRPEPPPGPSIPSSGSISLGGIVIQNEPSSVSLPPWEAPEQVRDMAVVSLKFSDGSSQVLPAISDSTTFSPNEYALDRIEEGKTIVSINLANNNFHRNVSLANVEVIDPNAVGELRPLNAVSTAQDAIITMEGIEIHRSDNTIDDLIPGLTLNLRAPSERPVSITVQPDIERIRDSIISLVGNYNRLMAEVNILTARRLSSSSFSTNMDTRVIDELTYLTREERDEYHNRLGVFQADSTLNQFRNALQRIVTAPYPTSAGREVALISHIGIGSDVGFEGASTGYDPARLRGYLDINPTVLDAAIASNLIAIRELFGSDTTGDLLVDTGIAYNIDNLTRPYIETGGIISIKTSTVDTRISSEQRRIDTMNRQLAARESELRVQYAQMENAFNRMERMGQSLDLFNQQQNNRNR